MQTVQCKLYKRTVLVVLPGLRLGWTPTTATALRNKNALVTVEPL